MVDRHHPGRAPNALLQKLSDGVCMTIAELSKDMDLTHRQVSNAAAILLRRGYLDRMLAGCYQLTEPGCAAAAAGEVVKSGPRGPNSKVRLVRNTLRQRAWSAMCVRRCFTVPDLVCDAALPSDRNPTENIQGYLRALSSAGYVRKMPQRSAGFSPTSNGFNVWILARKTGLTAPVVSTRLPILHDFNIGEDVPCNRR